MMCSFFSFYCPKLIVSRKENVEIIIHRNILFFDGDFPIAIILNKMGK